VIFFLNLFVLKKILVANRGEIALRVMRTAHEMGIKTVAVYSDADRHALHTRYATEAVHIGASAAKDSYLSIDKIIAACRQTGADAVHPGYGFLSENPEFAHALEAAGIVLIGPSAASMEIMGNKLAAKDAVKKYDIPMVPGTDGAITDVAAAQATAAAIGFPVLIKAAAGGGGKGMRIVENAQEFEEQMQLAVSEATSAFGDGAVFIEKYIASPRHIEIQIMGDTHGNIIYLHERECSIQRRHQKVVEEAPSSLLTPQTRKKMGEAAVRVAQACNYVGAGTVEFLADNDQNFYFLEMNTRLQVEHPVTELITGIDLVREQINVAQGKKLSHTQADLHIQGHAIELRIYAEDPENNFLPDIGTLHTYTRPQSIGVRVDDGYQQGMTIPIYYDPMIAKLVTHASTRQQAIDRMTRAINEYNITGVANTLKFGKFVMQHPAFISGDFDTNFVKQHYEPTLQQATKPEPNHLLIAAIVATQIIHKNQAQTTQTNPNANPKSQWKAVHQ
jgi:acetyl-CoA carboxylase biotin carboxylase subunit